MSDLQPRAPLPDYAPMIAAVRSDCERWPALDPEGFVRLQQLREAPHAPIWTHACGDLLTTADHAELGVWEAGLGEPNSNWREAAVLRAAQVVPFYRRLGVRDWADLPTVSRSDLVHSIADFVPTDVPLDRIVQGSSSGSTGAALVIPWHPIDIAKDVVLLSYLLSQAGVAWASDPDRLGMLSVVDQEQAYTYASAMTVRDSQLMARVSLRDSAWRTPGDRETFIRQTDPQLISGSALSLLRYAELTDIPAPLALVSGAIELTPAARAALTARFGAPVLDLYGLREVGPVAVATDGNGHVLVPRRIWVEIVDAQGRAVADGERGEIVVSSMENPYLPLLRYRTGDTAALVRRDGTSVLIGLEGRAPVQFRTAEGGVVASVELTQQLQHHGAHSWAVHQDATGEVSVVVLGGNVPGLARALTALLGSEPSIRQVESALDLGPGKPRRFSSDT